MTAVNKATDLGLQEKDLNKAKSSFGGFSMKQEATQAPASSFGGFKMQKQ